MYQCRRAVIQDVPALVKYRLSMFRLVAGGRKFEQEDPTACDAAWFTEALENERVAAWVVEDKDAQIVAVAALIFYYVTPKPWNTSGKYAYISSMYTEPNHRRQGLARRLLEAALDYAREHGVKNVTLHASQAGRPLYEALGFKATNEMILELPSSPSILR